MKILLATTAATLNGGGIGSYNLEFCNVFKDTSELHLLTTENLSDVEGYTRVFSVGIHPLKRYEDYRKLIDEINNEYYDVIFNSDSSEMAILAPFVKSPIVTVSHTFNNLPAIRAGANHEYLTTIIALSRAGKCYLEKKFNIRDKEKVTYLYNFVHHNTVDSVIDKINRTVPNIVFPGGAIPMKYPEMVVGAVNKLVKTNLKFNFYWYGNDIVPLRRFSLPQKVGDLVSKDKRLHIQGKVSRSESQSIIDSANIFILPSRAEGCPVSLMESMCTGCIPIVGDGRHVCREILEDGKFGVIVKKGSSDDLYNAFVEILTHPELFADSYQRTLDYSNNILSEDNWRRRMLDIFNNACNNTKKVIPLTPYTLMQSRVRFWGAAILKIIEDRLLSLKICVKFNYMYLKYKCNGTI